LKDVKRDVNGKYMTETEDFKICDDYEMLTRSPICPSYILSSLSMEKPNLPARVEHLLK
jgi:hypothetical protein